MYDCFVPGQEAGKLEADKKTEPVVTRRRAKIGTGKIYSRIEDSSESLGEGSAIRVKQALDSQ